MYKAPICKMTGLSLQVVLNVTEMVHKAADWKNFLHPVEIFLVIDIPAAFGQRQLANSTSPLHGHSQRRATELLKHAREAKLQLKLYIHQHIGQLGKVQWHNSSATAPSSTFSNSQTSEML
jgi:hypothetical protein